MQSAVGVPERKGRVVRSPGRELMDFEIHAPVLAVNVAKQGWRNRAVIERGVEDSLMILAIGFDRDFAELTFPGLTGGRAYCIEIPSGDFGFEVLQRAFRANAGNADFYLNSFTSRGGKREHALQRSSF